ncbi:unnamed protein product [Miscanthus lutarioriparius]|uniref:Uncharacterized protein n=1 Tax=Miscanthus lutarioriparius TaxID=422564 RepID=A0A811RG62_9POAL|nr:unnamed protein product [Miscanthus lutarioriparius]
MSCSKPALAHGRGWLCATPIDGSSQMAGDGASASHCRAHCLLDEMPWCDVTGLRGLRLQDWPRCYRTMSQAGTPVVLHLIDMDNNEDEESSDANCVLFDHETFPSWWRTTTIPLNNTYRHLYDTGCPMH